MENKSLTQIFTDGTNTEDGYIRVELQDKQFSDILYNLKLNNSIMLFSLSLVVATTVVMLLYKVFKILR